ncbi:MAG TPA: glycosyltransferase family 9 protein [Aromatoleum sp.]|uniref:glycosyltransferase family 9 protein n=1 Tax=Aromatoleum sp. TaxID=2307007 RepID=UPI002B471949|nr:glycosyltransferase family 9 protein [Aromatoleum sp.]HJV24418.1 glycosyltransferase family 9 protein [Aromatoleum sp.]
MSRSLPPGLPRAGGPKEAVAAVAGEPFGEVRRIAVLRANGLGDFVFAMPALAALRERYPHAQITLLGKRWHRSFLKGRSRLVDEVVALPPVPGVGVPEDVEVDEAAIDACVDDLRRRAFDLAFQFQGGGRYSNPFLLRLDARHSFGACAPGAQPLAHSIPYVVWQNERLRLLEVAALAGAPAIQLEPRLPVLSRDRRELAEQVTLPSEPLAVLSPGAMDPRRRWPVEHFAAVGDALAAAGAAVVVQGDHSERHLTAGVVAAMHRQALDLGGRLSLDGLTALLARARIMVANDSGPLHLAQAVGGATVGLYWLVNLFVSGPPTVSRRRYAMSLRLACPECGRENLAMRCEHDVSFIADIPVDEVLGLALALWHQETAVPVAPASVSR